MIDDETKKFLDFFEGVDDNLYSIYEIEVKCKKTGQIHIASSYLLNNFHHNLLTIDTILFETYSSINKYFAEYRKSEVNILIQFFFKLICFVNNF